MSPYAGIAAIRPWKWWAHQLAALAVLIAFFTFLLVVIA